MHKGLHKAVEQLNKDPELLNKVVKVIYSCKTLEQLEVARSYVNLACEKSDHPATCFLHIYYPRLLAKEAHLKRLMDRVEEIKEFSDPTN